MAPITITNIVPNVFPTGGAVGPGPYATLSGTGFSSVSSLSFYLPGYGSSWLLQEQLWWWYINDSEIYIQIPPVLDIFNGLDPTNTYEMEITLSGESGQTPVTGGSFTYLYQPKVEVYLTTPVFWSGQTSTDVGTVWLDVPAANGIQVNLSSPPDVICIPDVFTVSDFLVNSQKQSLASFSIFVKPTAASEQATITAQVSHPNGARGADANLKCQICQASTNIFVPMVDSPVNSGQAVTVQAYVRSTSPDVVFGFTPGDSPRNVSVRPLLPITVPVSNVGAGGSGSGHCYSPLTPTVTRLFTGSFDITASQGQVGAPTGSIQVTRQLPPPPVPPPRRPI
ncbi:hypothetical protein DFR50_12918 [Roseiarcus fermentans]|uniref:IPT/TIG domain-containing protein n=1 Tax=Roseiarcus fermentans TaxID=1473586 RepID=A0A366EXH7_9HYPH|nr:hypothetical protein [Roseiarcus fermentans]RBP07088.1 hypothetical protein DFR50_12918 [Roseiarcus fermentans]